MNYLVFFSDIQGHNLEYCHHLYNVAFNITNVEFIFIVPCEYNNICARFDWPNASNIKFDFIDEKTVRLIKEASALKRSFLISKVFLFYIKKYRPTASFVSTLLEIVPALPFMMFNKTKISGIIFRIYLYDWKTSSFLRKLLDLTKMIFISKAFCVSHALVLNDKISSRYFNQLFCTRKFEFIPDPYIPISSTKDENFRNKFNIKGNTLLFSHIGAMNYSKGTLDLLDAIDCLIQKQGISDVTFAFFGKVNEDIKEDFYRRLSEIEKNANIIVYDTFCEYQTIANLCIESSLLILPYKRCAQSSGIIGYASQFSVPVLVPNRGLLARLVSNYGLGYLYDINEKNALANSIYKFIQEPVLQKPSREYCVANSLSSFLNKINDVIYEDIC